MVAAHQSVPHRLGRAVDAGPREAERLPVAGATGQSQVLSGLTDEMSAQLERAGFAPPGNDPDAWSNLARVIGIDPNDRTVREIYDEALAWVERIRVAERIRRAVNDGRSSTQQAREVPENTGFAFTGSSDWENWGLGLDTCGMWHLFHFGRRDGSWRRHAHSSLQIPRGMPDSLAQEFISTGLLEISQAHAVWKRYANGFTSKARTVQTVKAPLSRLRRAVRDAVRKEGHRPHGTLISWLRDQNCWQARIKFGYATRREKGGVGFQTRY